MDAHCGDALVDTVQGIIATLKEALQLGSRADALVPETPLLGNLPELDSWAVVAVVTALEERFAITIDDEDVSADIFETIASLAAFVDGKRAAA